MPLAMNNDNILVKAAILRSKPTTVRTFKRASGRYDPGRGTYIVVSWSQVCLPLSLSGRDLQLLPPPTAGPHRPGMSSGTVCILEHIFFLNDSLCTFSKTY